MTFHLNSRPRGLFLIDINAVALAARKASEQSVLNPARKTETFATVENKSQPFMQSQSDVSSQKADTLTCQQPLPSRFSSFHARPLTMNVSSQLDLQSPSENSECEPNGNAQKSQMSEVATSDQVIADPTSISSETVASTHVAESTPEAAATAGGRGRVAKLVPLPAGRPTSPEVDFGNKHRGEKFEVAWKDQSWVNFIATHYAQSKHMSHRLVIRYIELMVEKHEMSGVPSR